MLVLGLLLAGLTAPPASATAFQRICGPTSTFACTTGGYGAANVGWPDAYYGTAAGVTDGHNCTRYAAFKLMQNGLGNPGRSFGNAYEWDERVTAIYGGGHVDGNPVVGSIAQWEIGGFGGSLGHVAYVEEVGADYIRISADNYSANGGYTNAYIIPRGDSAWPTHFIHLADRPSWPPANGTFVSVIENGMVYRIAGGAPLYVSSWDHVGGPQAVQVISQSQLDSLPVVPADGTFINGMPSGAVFRVAGGAPLYLSSWDAVGGQQPTITVDDVAIGNAGGGYPWQHLRSTPADMFLRGVPSGRVFRVVAQGHPYYIGSWDPFGGPQPFVDVDDWAIGHCDHLNCNPFGALDDSRDAGNAIRVLGWAMDPNDGGSVGVHVYVDGVHVGSGVASVSRPDVDAVYHRGAAFGYDLTVPTSAGHHQVCTYGLNVGPGSNDLLGCRDVDVTAGPVNTSKPSLVGAVRVASTVTCDPGEWQAAPSLNYRWLVDGTEVTNYGEPSIAVTESYYGKSLACKVIGVSTVGSSTALSGAAEVAVGPALTASIKPQLSGRAKVGKRLKVTAGDWDPSQTKVSYQWRVDGKKIHGATKSSYKIKRSNRHHKISCSVKASRRGWTSATIRTAAKKVS